MQQFVSDLVHQSCKFLGGGQHWKQSNLTAGRDAPGGRDVGGMDDRDGLPCQPCRQAYAETNHVALDFGQMRQFVSAGLADIEYVGGAESEQLALRRDRFFWSRFTLFALAPDHGCQNEDATLAFVDKAAERIPGAKAGDSGCVRFLPGNEHDVSETVAVEPSHCSKVLDKHFTSSRLQGFYEILDRLFCSPVDVVLLHDCCLLLPYPAVFVVHHRHRDKNRWRRQGRRGSREGCQVASGSAGRAKQPLPLVWRDTGASPKQPSEPGHGRAPDQG